MTARPLAIGLDVGTQGTKALVWDLEKERVVARASESYGLLADLAPGAAEQHPETWTAAVLDVLARVLEEVDGSAVGALAVSGQQHGCVLLDGEARPLRPAKLWCDTQTAAEAAELALPAGYTAPKVLWSQRHEPELFARVATILLPHDYINLFLTGELAAEWGDASGTGYFDARQRRWQSTFFDESLLPPLIEPGAQVGTLRPELARQLGLGEVPVAAGSGDNMLSAIGAGAGGAGASEARTSDARVLVISLGTSGTLFTPTAAPLMDPTGEVAPFCDATGGGLPLVCTMNCTTVTEEVRSAFGLDHRELTLLAAKEPAGCGELRFLPYLAGERTPNWPGASAVIHGLRSASLAPGPLYRAALEGASFCLWRGLGALERMGVEARELRLVGGGAANLLWRSIIADLFGLPVRVPLETETAALGAALSAAALITDTPVGTLAAALPMEGEALSPRPEHTDALRTAAEDHARLSDTLFA
jgi:xylulokinase